MEEIFLDNQHCTPDGRLLERYSGHLIERGMSPSTQTSLLAIAAKFLHWWRQTFVGEHYVIDPWRHQWQIRQIEGADLREKYLQVTCPDHQLRCSRRTDLMEFFGYLAGSADIKS